MYKLLGTRRSDAAGMGRESGRWLAAGIGLAVVIALAGCGGSGNTGAGGTSTGGQTGAKSAGAPMKIAIITNGFSPFWDSMAKGMKDAAATYHVTADYTGPPSAQVGEQKSLMEQKADDGYQGIAVSAIEAGAITPVINELVNRGILVISFDSDAPKSKRLIYIGTDNFKSGELIGGEMVKLLPSGGNVWGFVGNISAENARDRMNGFLAAVKGHNIKLVDVKEDQKDPNTARQNVETVLQANPGKIAGLVGFYSYNLPAIATAVQNAGLRNKIKIVGFDAEPRTLQALKANPPGIDATVVQKPYEFGRLSVEFLYLAHKDGPKKAMAEWNSLNPDFPLVGDKVNTGATVITSANMKPFLAQLAKWGVTSS